MGNTPENEDEAEQPDRRLSYLLNAGELGVCFLLLSAMIAVPKQEFDESLTFALVALVFSIPLSEAYVSVSNKAKGPCTLKTSASDVLLVRSHFLSDKNSMTVHV